MRYEMPYVLVGLVLGAVDIWQTLHDPITMIYKILHEGTLFAYLGAGFLICMNLIFDVVLWPFIIVGWIFSFIV